MASYVTPFINPTVLFKNHNTTIVFPSFDYPPSIINELHRTGHLTHSAITKAEKVNKDWRKELEIPAEKETKRQHEPVKKERNQMDMLLGLFGGAHVDKSHDDSQHRITKWDSNSLFMGTPLIHIRRVLAVALQIAPEMVSIQNQNGKVLGVQKIEMSEFGKKQQAYFISNFATIEQLVPAIKDLDKFTLRYETYVDYVDSMTQTEIVKIRSGGFERFYSEEIQPKWPSLSHKAALSVLYGEVVDADLALERDEIETYNNTFYSLHHITMDMIPKSVQDCKVSVVNAILAQHTTYESIDIELSSLFRHLPLTKENRITLITFRDENGKVTFRINESQLSKPSEVAIMEEKSHSVGKRNGIVEIRFQIKDGYGNLTISQSGKFRLFGHWGIEDNDPSSAIQDLVKCCNIVISNINNINQIFPKNERLDTLTQKNVRVNYVLTQTIIEDFPLISLVTLGRFMSCFKALKQTNQFNITYDQNTEIATRAAMHMRLFNHGEEQEKHDVYSEISSIPGMTPSNLMLMMSKKYYIPLAQASKIVAQNYNVTKIKTGKDQIAFSQPTDRGIKITIPRTGDISQLHNSYQIVMRLLSLFLHKTYPPQITKLVPCITAIKRETPRMIKKDGTGKGNQGQTKSYHARLDPQLFDPPSRSNQFPPYSRACQPKARQPLVFTDETLKEFKKQKGLKFDNKRLFSYKSGPNNTSLHYYCNSDEFQSPGFLHPGRHPDYLCMPCCNKRSKEDNEGKRQNSVWRKCIRQDLRHRGETQSSSTLLSSSSSSNALSKAALSGYLRGPEKPLSQGEIGRLPPILSLFLSRNFNSQCSVTQNNRIARDYSCFVRIGSAMEETDFRSVIMDAMRDVNPQISKFIEQYSPTNIVEPGNTILKPEETNTWTALSSNFPNWTFVLFIDSKEIDILCPPIVTTRDFLDENNNVCFLIKMATGSWYFIANVDSVGDKVLVFNKKNAPNLITATISILAKGCFASSLSTNIFQQYHEKTKQDLPLSQKEVNKFINLSNVPYSIIGKASIQRPSHDSDPKTDYVIIARNADTKKGKIIPSSLISIPIRPSLSYSRHPMMWPAPQASLSAVMEFINSLPPLFPIKMSGLDFTQDVQGKKNVVGVRLTNNLTIPTIPIKLSTIHKIIPNFANDVKMFRVTFTTVTEAEEVLSQIKTSSSKTQLNEKLHDVNVVNQLYRLFKTEIALAISNGEINVADKTDHVELASEILSIANERIKERPLKLHNLDPYVLAGKVLPCNSKSSKHGCDETVCQSSERFGCTLVVPPGMKKMFTQWMVSELLMTEKERNQVLNNAIPIGSDELGLTGQEGVMICELKSKRTSKSKKDAELMCRPEHKPSFPFQPL